MRNIGEGIPFAPLYERPSFMSKKGIACIVGAALVSAAALSAMALYVTPFNVAVAAACMAVAAGTCLMKKGVNYYSKITQDLQEARLNLHLQLGNTERGILDLQNDFQQLERQMDGMHKIVEDYGKNFIKNAEQVNLEDCRRQALIIDACASSMQEVNFPAGVALIKEHVGSLMILFIKEAQYSKNIPSSIVNVTALLELDPQFLDSYSNCVRVANELATNSFDIFKEIIEEMKQLHIKYDHVIADHKKKLIKKKEEFSAQWKELVASEPKMVASEPKMQPLEGPAGAGVKHLSTHFVERHIVPYLPFVSRAQKHANLMYGTWQSEVVSLSKRVHDRNALLKRGRAEFQQIHREYLAMHVMHQNRENVVRKYQLMCNVNNVLFEIVKVCKQVQSAQSAASSPARPAASSRE